MSATALLLTAVALLALALLLAHNRFVTLRNRMRSALADLDVQLRRRADLVPSLVETVKAHAGHERAVLSDAAAARAAAAAATPAERSAAEGRVAAGIERLLALAEAYPPLKADRSFLALQDELAATENKIAFSRQLVNDTVASYRDATQSFPGVLVARPLGFRPPEFLAVDAAESAPVRVRSQTGG